MLESMRAPALAEWSMQENEAGASPLSLRSLLDTVRRRWLALTACLVATLVLAGIYILITPQKYSATITLLIDSRLAQLSQTDGSAAVVDQAAVESQIELLRSEKMVQSVIDKLNLVGDPEFGGPPAGSPAAPPGGTAVDDRGGSIGDVLRRFLPWGGAAKEPARPDVALRRAVAILTGNLYVTRIGRSYLVSVTYSSVDPVKAARIANEVAGAYISDQIGAKVQSAKDQNAWFDQQVSEMRARAAQTYRAVQDFKGANDINPLRDLGVQSEMDRLASEVSRLRAMTISARAELDRTVALLSSPAATSGKMPEAAALRALADPDVDRLAARIAALDGGPAAAGDAAKPSGPAEPGAAPADRSSLIWEVWARISQLASSQRSKWQEASGKQQTLEGSLGDMRLRDTRARLIQERLRELETEAATARSLYESYLNQLTHAAQQQPVPASDARVISAASVPLYPGTPRKSLIVPLAAMAGAVLGLAAAFILQAMDDVIRTRDRLERLTGVPCFGIAPFQRWKQERQPDASSFDRLCSAFPRLVASGPRSKASDMLRNLQLTIYGGMRPDAAILGVTSAVPGEGKTTVALNLAVSACHAGRRVLLVDANLRNLTLSQAGLPDGFAVAPGVGQQQAVHIGEGLDLLPASTDGTIPGAELPDPDHLQSALVAARKHYDLVVVDLPSILPLAELRSVVRQLDSVVLVTRWGSTTGMQIERALRRLAEPDRLLGVVLNGVNLRLMRRFEGSSHHAYADRR